LYCDSGEIDKFINEYDDGTKAIKEELLRLCWYMRGGLSYSESHLLTVDERKLIGKIVESNLETTKTTQLPFF
jgi:hypothetical protein